MNNILISAMVMMSFSTAYGQDYYRFSVIDKKLTKAIIAVESSGDSKAISKVGAKGLMQVTKIAVKDVIEHQSTLPIACSVIDSGIDLFDPDLNVLVGSCYFKLLELYVGDDQTFQILAYNAGPGRVLKWLDGKATLPPETRQYLKKINKQLHK